MPALKNAKHERFANEYVVDNNGNLAAIRTGYSEKTARSQASTLLTNPNIMERVKELQDAVNKESQVDARYVRDRLIEMDQLDILDIFTKDMEGFKPLDEWPKAWRISISGVDLSEIWEVNNGTRDIIGTLKKIKWPDKVKNLKLLGDHIEIGAFKTNVDLSGGEGLTLNMNFGTGE